MYKYVYKVLLSSDSPSFKSSIPCDIISDKEVESISDYESITDECIARCAHNTHFFKKAKCKIEVQKCIICNMQYNEFLPENFFHLLHYLREAIYIYANFEVNQNVEEILDKFKNYKFDHTDGMQCSYNISCPDAEFISVKASYYDQSKIYQYYNTILQEIINAISIEGIRLYDKMGTLYELESRYHTHSTTKDILFHKIQCGMHVVFEVLSRFSNTKTTRSIRDWKHRYMYQNIENLRALSLEEALLHLRRSIILNHKFEALYREPINATLSGRNDDNIGNVNDSLRDDIIAKISKNFKCRDTVKEMLEKFNKDYLIMNNPKFKKKFLATLIYIMYRSDNINREITFNDFKDDICRYYEKSNISFKPNKIRDAAISEYEMRSHVYSKYKIRIR